METVADRLEQLKERTRSDTPETLDRRIEKWLGRLHNAGFWLEMSHAGNGLTTATIRTMLGEDRSREEMIVTVKPDLNTERCSWFVDLRSDEPGPAGDPPGGQDRAPRPGGGETDRRAGDEGGARRRRERRMADVGAVLPAPERDAELQAAPPGDDLEDRAMERNAGAGQRASGSVRRTTERSTERP